MITFAEESVALRHWPVGKYFYASFKCRPLTGLWKLTAAAREKLAFCRARFAQMRLSFLFLWGGWRERRKPILALSPEHSSSIIQPGPLSVWKKPSNYTEESQIHNEQKLTTNKNILIHVHFKEPIYFLLFCIVYYYTPVFILASGYQGKRCLIHTQTECTAHTKYRA